MRRIVEIATNGFGKILGALAGLILLGLMLLTCADVIGRYFFSQPIYGAFELTELLLAALIFAGLPLVTLRQDHVTVDVLDPVTPPLALRLQHIVANAIAATGTGYLAWRLWLRGDRMLEAGETTAQLKITLAWLTYGMAVMMALTALAFLIVVFAAPRHQPSGEAPADG